AAPAGARVPPGLGPGPEPAAGGRHALRLTALAQLRAAGKIIADLKRELGVGRLRPPPEIPPHEDEPLPPLPPLWPPDGALVGHWAEPDSRMLRERPVHLIEDREKLIAEREAMLAERARLRRRWAQKQRRRARRRG
ncbi:MAG TPA: hypothetical protein VEA79_14710, partial [Phenylobacterium sp.]|nr:hypothetical protein [Phenylobacterium sp.]